jgi:RNA recognition motif-containing protein
MGRKLYVGNLPYEVGETELQELFTRSGSVESVSVMRDRATGRARRFAFVEMSSDEEAPNAIRPLNAIQVGGRSLTVNEARPKAVRTLHKSTVGSLVAKLTYTGSTCFSESAAIPPSPHQSFALVRGGCQCKPEPDPEYQARCAGWLARGAAHDRPVHRRLAIAVPL